MDHAGIKFPELPKYAGDWCAVYYTPISGSGERLTAFVVARGEDGQVCLRPTIRQDVLNVAFGDQAPGVSQMLSLVKESLIAWAASLPDQEIAWRSPFLGFAMGPWRKALANNVRQIAAQGVVMEAAFADHQFADLNQD